MKLFHWKWKLSSLIGSEGVQMNDISLFEYLIRYFNQKKILMNKAILLEAETSHRNGTGVQMNCPPRATLTDDQWFHPFLSMITKVIKFLRTDPNAAFHTKQTADPKFQKRRSPDHLLLKWSPPHPWYLPGSHRHRCYPEIELWYEEVNTSARYAARSLIA